MNDYYIRVYALLHNAKLAFSYLLECAVTYP